MSSHSQSLRALLDNLEAGLEDWAKHIPHDYPGDDGAGYSASRATFDELVQPPLDFALAALEASGLQITATSMRGAFLLLADQSHAFDKWTAGNPAPNQLAYWPPKVAAAAVGDPDFCVLRRCRDLVEAAHYGILTENDSPEEYSGESRFAEGFYPDDAADRLGVSTKTLNRRAKDAGVAVPARGQRGSVENPRC